MAALTEAEQIRKRQGELSRSYDKFLEQLHFYEDSKWTEKDRVVCMWPGLLANASWQCRRNFLIKFTCMSRMETTDRLQKL